MTGWRLLALALCFALSPAATAQEPGPLEPEPEPIAVDVEDLRSEIQKILDENEIPGASVALVSSDETIWAGGVGKADVTAGIDVTADHLFRVGSISKSFTALGVLAAVESGLLDLETPVRELAPEVEFTNRWAASHPITVAMVLEHTTGFDDIHPREYAKVDDPDIGIAQGLAYNGGSRASRWKPGTHMSYCNAGPPIAAYIVGKLAGEDFEDYVRENVFDPLGMTHSTFRFPNDATMMARGYDSDGETEANYDHIIIRPSGALNASAAEMARYLRMMINRGTLDDVEILRPETIRRMETPTTTLSARAGSSFGYGLGNYPSIVEGHLFQGHNGGITGFVSTSAYSSELGVGYFVSINKPSGGLRDIAVLVAQRLTEGFEKPTPPAATLSDEELRAITGFYRSLTPRNEIVRVATRLIGIERITLREGELFQKDLFGGKARKLFPITATSLRLEDQPVATLFLVEDEDGHTILQQALGDNSRKVSGASVFLRLALAALTLLVLISAVLFALIWGPARLFRRMARIPVQTVLWPLLATLALPTAYILPLAASSNLVQDLGTRTWISQTAFLGSWVFVLLTAVSLYTSLRSYAVEMGRWVRLHSVLVSLACAVMVVYLWYSGLIGLRTWLY